MKIAKKTFLAGLAVLPATTALAWDLNLGKDKKVEFHGFASQGFLASTDYDYLGTSKDGSFQFNEVGLNASFSPFNRTRITAQGFMFDIGDVGNNRMFLDYASIEYTFSDYLAVRGGRVRRAGGIYNHIQDVDLARTSVLLPQGVYDARWRDFSTSADGAVVFGNVGIGKIGSLSYELTVGKSMSSKDTGGVARWIEDAFSTSLTEFEQPLYTGGQIWWNTPLNGLRAGVAIGQQNDFGFHTTTAVSPVGPAGPINAYSETLGDAFFQQYSLEYIWKTWTFQAEYFTYSYEATRTTRVLSGTTPIQPTIVSATEEEPDAWYLSAAYRLNSWLEVGSYYTEHYVDRDARSGSPDSSQRDVALSFRFDPTEWWTLKLEGHYIRGTSLLQDSANNPTRDEDGWFMFAAKTTFSF